MERETDEFLLFICITHMVPRLTILGWRTSKRTDY